MARKKTTATRSWSNADPKDRIDTVDGPRGAKLRRCRAQVKRTDPPRRCSKPAMKGKQVCRSHGGRSPGGPAKTGRHSVVMGPLQAAFERNLENPNPKDLDIGLAKMDAYIETLLERAASGDTPDLRAEVAGRVGKLAAKLEDDGALISDDSRKMVAELLDVATKARESSATLAKAMAYHERRQAAATRALEIELRGEQVVAVRHVSALLTLVCEIVMREAPDHAGRIVDALSTEVLGDGGGERFSGLAIGSGEIQD